MEFGNFSRAMISDIFVTELDTVAEALHYKTLSRTNISLDLAIIIALLCLFCLWRFTNNNYWHGRFYSIATSGFKNKLSSFTYLIRGADMIDDEYCKSNGQPFIIYTPGKKNIMVTSKEHIREINNAPNHVLSLHAVAKDFLQPKYTMNGFEWKNQRGIEGVGFVRALRTLLTQRLPALLPNLELAIREQFVDELQKCERIKGSFKVPVLAIAEKLVTKCNATVFFGEELSSNEEFLQAALLFPKDCVLAAEILRLMPNRLGSSLSWCVTRRYRASTIMHDRLLEIVQKRLDQQESFDTPIASDGIQWLIDTSPKRAHWTAERLVGETMAIWYGSVHTLAIATSYALLDLYSHSEYIELIRKELQGSSLEEFKRTAEGLPILDSFLKESARLSAFESTGVRRQALEPFTLSGGLTIEPGDWICVPHRSMMRSEANFRDALAFRPFRKSDEMSECHTSDSHLAIGKPAHNGLTDSSESWLVWGAGRILCPGRFYAAMILKLIVAHLVTDYDVLLPESTASRSIQWRST
ncbi:hypothetical protein ACMFMG_005738, partial [Clarireedia jacksonii]